MTFACFPWIGAGALTRHVLRFLVLALLTLIGASVATPTTTTATGRSTTSTTIDAVTETVRIANSASSQLTRQWRDMGTRAPVDLDALENDLDDDDDDSDGHKHAALKHAAKDIPLPSSRAIAAPPHVRTSSDPTRFTTSTGFPRGPPRA